MYCNQCGAYLAEGALACPVCGCLVSTPPVPPSPVAGESAPVPAPRPEENHPAGPAAPATPASGPAPAPPAPALGEPAPATPPPAPEAPKAQPAPGPIYARTAPPAGGLGTPGNPPPAGPAHGAPGAVPPPRPGAPAHGAPGVLPPPRPAAPAREQLSPTVGMGEWLWSSIVAAIPLVGFIVLLIWAFGGGAKPSKRNWARASLILYAAIAVLYVLVAVVILAAAVAGNIMDPGPHFYMY